MIFSETINVRVCVCVHCVRHASNAIFNQSDRPTKWIQYSLFSTVWSAIVPGVYVLMEANISYSLLWKDALFLSYMVQYNHVRILRPAQMEEENMQLFSRAIATAAIRAGRRKKVMLSFMYLCFLLQRVLLHFSSAMYVHVERDGQEMGKKI